ncbi:hypothetical protein PSA7680_01515 [Pseudoruegeria aquimaris]|uniref:Uncharacterized protein n=1 Tax=Pseudoruegeria aquimaris TaxID=393663 RepID=A0A1Y5S6S1_9RHOB|nr:hypothetical protein [Pseudoruegeria aquimaris]SLN31427.1 hypothetical protein PSA7680_01515 [Pseudoruegeria aquimaris]
MTAYAFSMLYAALAALPAAMHLALAAGAPLGRFTVGGRFANRLPPAWRVLAVVQAVVLAMMASVILQRGGALALGWPAWTFWASLALSALTFLANAASPSRPERLLWGPVTLGMLLCAIVTAHP